MELSKTCHAVRERPSPNDLQGKLTIANEGTDSNAASFDAANGFAGRIAGLHDDDGVAANPDAWLSA